MISNLASIIQYFLSLHLSPLSSYCQYPPIPFSIYNHANPPCITKLMRIICTGNVALKSVLIRILFF